MMLPEDAGKRVELQELALRADGRTDEALRINDTRLAKIPFGTPEYALTSYQRAMIYRQKKDREKVLFGPFFLVRYSVGYHRSCFLVDVG